MPNCVVEGCKFSKSDKGTYQSFYFPKDEALKAKWLDNITKSKNLEIGEKSAVCMKHFQIDDFEPKVIY